jgi:pimeloyl-ACP methyl ester carboxylesterase
MRRLLKWMWRGLLGLLALVLVYFGACVAYVQWREIETPSFGAPAAGRFVDAGGVAVYSQETNGKGKRGTVLLVHGTGAWSGTWFSLLPALERAGYRVVAIDLPPFGYSDKSTSLDFSRTAQAERIRAVLDARGIARAIVVGHSFGGGPALEFALRHPERTQRLVLVDAAIGLDSPPPDPASPACRVLGNAPARRVLLAGTASNPLLAGPLLKSFVARKDAVTPARLAEFAKPQSVEGFSAALGAWANAFACHAETGLSMQPEAIAHLRPPLALLWGAQDSVTPLPQGRRLQALVPGSSLRELPGVGHIPHIEDPPAFEQALLEALR